jgi:anaerobic magnesium-protoporphyrin IX monomethyl ester cyclase
MVSDLISIIRPSVLVAKWAHTTPICPPIGLTYLAGTLIDAGYDVSIVDAVGEAPGQLSPIDDDRFLVLGLKNDEILERLPAATRIVGVSCMFSHEWPITRNLITAVRERFPDAVIVAGGEHITAMPDYSLESCPALDLCVLGEGEEVFLAVVEAVQNGRSAVNIPGTVYRKDGTPIHAEMNQRIRNIDTIPKPAWHLIPMNNYLSKGYGFGVGGKRNMPILATRGCPYQCTFCSNKQMWGTRWIARHPVSVLDEMETYLAEYDIENFDFYDLTAVVKKDWIVEFCNLILERRLKFTWQLPSGTRSEAIDDEVADLLFRSGCRNISFAPESGSPAVLERIKKKIKLDRMLTSIGATVKRGINSKANIIIGFPGETHREIWQTLFFTVKMAWRGLHDVSFSPFSPYPGSELFDDLKIDDRSDTFFYSLASYTDLRSTISYSENVSDGWLGFYRLFGMLIFYSSSYLFRPWRFLVTAYHLATKRHESRLEMSIHDLFVRLSRVKAIYPFILASISSVS